MINYLISNYVKVKAIKKAVLSKYQDDYEEEAIKPLTNFNLSINNLSFSYNSDKQILDKLSLDIKPKTKYLIEAISGKGKTTLFNLITKQLDNYSGDIYLGNDNIKDLNQATINNYIGYVTQDTYIFTASIKDNITLFSEVDEVLLDQVCKQCDIYSINQDINHLIENNGENISGGQKQKIALARELINNHEIILLDETLNSLDNTSINELLDIILKLDKTVIMIAHNLDEKQSSYFNEVINL